VRAVPRSAALLLGVVLLAGCGSDGESEAAPTAAPATTPTPCASAEPVQDARPTTSTDLQTKPTIEATEGPPPCGLVVRDVVVGDGAEAVPGSRVRAKYVLAFYESGEEVDSSWRISPEQTLPFQVGGGNLIPGFDQGVTGMRQGGRREIVVPSELGYGTAGSGPIPPGSTLVFLVDLVEVAEA
jgi:FKBP-type peptidyl-prolyl cis-trans isomerase